MKNRKLGFKEKNKLMGIKDFMANSSTQLWKK